MSSSTSEQWSNSDKEYMQEAFSEAHLALNEGEVPVGCVLVDVDHCEILARGHNKVNVSSNPTRHAEFEALDTLTYPSKHKMRLYVTCEPCGMCAAALRYAGVTDVVYGCANERFGGCGTVTPSGSMPLFQQSGETLSLTAPLSVRAGLSAEEAVELLQTFYKQENPTAPPEKRKRKI